MQIHQKDDNLIFFPNIGMGKVKFFYTEKNIISLWGQPIFQKIDKETNCVNYDYQLYNARISLFFHYENDNFDYLSIHTNKLFINNKDISLMDKTVFQNWIEQYHKNINILYISAEDTKDSYKISYMNEYNSGNLKGIDGKLMIPRTKTQSKGDKFERGKYD